MKKFALKFDGSQNYASLGTMGNFGSNLASGMYVKFDIKTNYTVDVDARIFGVAYGNLWLGARLDTSGTHCFFIMKDTNAIELSGFITTAFNDGYKHTVEITWNPTAKTITFLLDNVSIPVNYSNQNQPATFSNLTSPIFVGAHSQVGSPSNYIPCIIDNFQIGVSKIQIYGSYFFDKFPNNCFNDFSGKGNNGALQGSPKPQIVQSLQNLKVRTNSLRSIKNGRLFLPSKSIPNVI